MDLKTLCLGALCLGDASGYDIKKLFESALNHFHHASFGSIYPALKNLEQEGMVHCRVERGTRHPDRKLFSVTDAGRRAFVQALESAEPAEQLRSEFLVMLFFAHLLPTESLAAKLDKVERRYEAELEYLERLGRDSETTAGISLTIDLGIAVYRARLETLRARRGDLLARHRVLPAGWREDEHCEG